MWFPNSDLYEKNADKNLTLFNKYLPHWIAFKRCDCVSGKQDHNPVYVQRPVRDVL